MCIRSPAGSIGMLSVLEQQDTVVDVQGVTVVDKAKPDPSTQRLTPGQEILFGGAAGMFTRLIVTPLDVVKIRFQLQYDPAIREASNIMHGGSTVRSLRSAIHFRPVQGAQYRTVTQAIKTIVKEEGFFALWKGLVPGQIMVIPYSAMSFYTFHRFTAAANERAGIAPHHLTDEAVARSTMISLIGGALGGFVATSSTYPLDLIRTRLVAQQTNKIYLSIPKAVALTYRTEGLRGFYHGLVPTLFGIIPYSSLGFASYQFFKDSLLALHMRTALSQDVDPDSIGGLAPFEKFICGFGSGITAKFFTLPIDVIKKRFQVRHFDWEATKLRTTMNVPGANTSREFSSVLQCARAIRRTEGLRGFFKGAVPSLIKSGPNWGVTFFLYEAIVGWFADDDSRAASQSELN